LARPRGGQAVTGPPAVMPDLISVNPYIRTVVIGEKCADMLKEDR